MLSEEKIKDYLKHVNLLGANCDWCKSRGVDVIKCKGGCVDKIFKLFWEDNNG